MAKDLKERFGEALQALRRSQGKSQEALEVVHRTYLSELERGLKSPTLETIVRLAGALEVSPAYLVSLATTPEADLPSEARVGTLDLAAILSRALPTAADPTNPTSEVTALFSSTSTLADVAALAATRGVGLDRLLGEATLLAFRDRAGGQGRATRNALRLLVADKRPPDQLLFTKNSKTKWVLEVGVVLKAAVASNRVFELVHDLFIAYDVPLFELLGLRNLNSFVGAVYGRELWRLMKDRTYLNPHQDGYPDLCASTPEGLGYYAERERRGQLTVKSFWSPYPHGGIEVKTTCGDTPSAKKIPKRKIGEPRYDILKSATWKAHHVDTNNLLGTFWDFIDGLPTVIAAFYRNDLVPDDWRLHTPGKGSHATSVAILEKGGVRKMGKGWLLLPTAETLRTSMCNRKVFDVSEEDVKQYSSTPLG